MTIKPSNLVPEVMLRRSTVFSLLTTSRKRPA